MNTTELVERDAIRAVVHHGGYGTDADHLQMDAWSVTLIHGDRTMGPLAYFTGKGLRKGYRPAQRTGGGKAEFIGSPVKPSADAVLDCLLSDASGELDSFEDWCADYGYDSDSRKAERIFFACQKVKRDLRAFLGAKFPEYMEADRL